MILSALLWSNENVPLLSFKSNPVPDVAVDIWFHPPLPPQSQVKKWNPAFAFVSEGMGYPVTTSVPVHISSPPFGL